jgi:hypothetical protein
MAKRCQILVTGMKYIYEYGRPLKGEGHFI